MRTVRPGMDVARQLRKLDAAASTPEQARYAGHLKGLLLASVAAGLPQPASDFIPALHEEFGL